MPLTAQQKEELDKIAQEEWSDLEDHIRYLYPKNAEEILAAFVPLFWSCMTEALVAAGKGEEMKTFIAECMTEPTPIIGFDV